MSERGFPILSTSGLTVTTTAGRTLLRDVALQIPAGRITALIGPSGAGKTTLLKCLNRLIDLTPTIRVTGEVRFAGEDIRGRNVDPDDLRRRIGTVFQQPVTFPGSIAHNVTFAARKIGLIAKRQEPETIERCLTAAGLWNETRDRLREPATILSVGQQQRLAIARVLAGDPEVLLMDEPTSALDTKSTTALEETIYSLKNSKTIVMVTHQLPQARRVADWVACLCPKDGAGELTEANECARFFEQPEHPGTVEFLSCCSA